MTERISKTIDESISIILEAKREGIKIKIAVDMIIKCLMEGNKIVIFGNGGSAADAQHMAAEFVGRYLHERKSLSAIALTTDTSIITAIGNDYGFEHVFARQCESIVNQGDVIIAISTSGKSPNLINGIMACKKKKAKIIGLTGAGGTNLQELVDVLITADSKSTPRIQEVHRIIIHIICELVEDYFI